MPNGKSGKAGAPESLSPHDKIARLLGILAVKDKTEPAEQVILLQGAGFQQGEIASMLGITENNISVINYRLRKQKQKRGRSTKR